MKAFLLPLTVPTLLALYGIFFSEKREGYQMIEGMLLLLIAFGGAFLGMTLAFVLRNRGEWAKRWYVSIGFGVLGCLITFLALYVYAQVTV